MLHDAAQDKEGATVFGYWVADPERYGVIEYGDGNRVLSIEEKPVRAKSNYAVVGLYFYDSQITDIAEQVRPSPRGELEITEVNNIYLRQNQLHAKKLGRGAAWLDTGTHESLIEASNFIHTIEKRQGLKVACLEEVAYQMGYIDADAVLRRAKELEKTEYGQYLSRLVCNDRI
jgi:glucose-1-phosphate thymidylyltransferase